MSHTQRCSWSAEGGAAAPQSAGLTLRQGEIQRLLEGEGGAPALGDRGQAKG